VDNAVTLGRYTYPEVNHQRIFYASLLSLSPRASHEQHTRTQRCRLVHKMHAMLSLRFCSFCRHLSVVGCNTEPHECRARAQGPAGPCRAWRMTKAGTYRYATVYRHGGIAVKFRYGSEMRNMRNIPVCTIYRMHGMICLVEAGVLEHADRTLTARTQRHFELIHKY
jgi:hypothetical protein